MWQRMFGEQSATNRFLRDMEENRPEREALLAQLLGTPQEIQRFGRTKSTSPATSVYWTVAFKAFEQALPTFILLTQFNCMKDIRNDPHYGLEKSLLILLQATIFSSLTVVWMDWNKLQYRSTPEYDLYWLTKDIEIKPHALYFYLQNDVLHYLIQKDQEILEIKSLENLDADVSNLIKTRQFNRLTAEQCDLLKQAVDEHHKPGLKPDALVIPGHTIDSTLVLKCIATQFLISITSGTLLALSLTEKQDFHIKIATSIVVSTLNFLKNLVTDSIAGINAHTLSVSHQANEDGLPTHSNLAPLEMQPGYWYIFNPFFIWCLRNIGATILASFSAAGLFAQLTSFIPSLLAGVISLIFYVFSTSSLRIFNGVVAKNILEPTITYDMETSFANNPSFFGKFMNEILSWRYLTVDYFLQDGYFFKGWSPAVIVNIFISMIIASALTLIYAPVSNYLLCFSPNCFNAGNGSTLSFLLTADRLDAFAQDQPWLFPLLFAILFGALGFMAVNIAFSQRANILNYLEDRAEALEVPVKKQSASTRESLCDVNDDSQKIVLVDESGARHSLFVREKKVITLHAFTSMLQDQANYVSTLNTEFSCREKKEITLRNFRSMLQDQENSISTLNTEFPYREKKETISNNWCCCFTKPAARNTESDFIFAVDDDRETNSV